MTIHVENPARSRREKVSRNRTDQASQTGDSRLLDKDPDLCFPKHPIRDASARFVLQEIARDLRPNSRIKKCLRLRIPGRDMIEVWRKPKARRAYYQHLVTCGLIWQCAVCASRITETARAELVELLGQGEVQIVPEVGPIVIPLYHLAMGTFTIRHRKRETAGAVLDRLSKAYRVMWGGRWSVGFHDHYRMAGLIRSIDYTYGDHGHHFHFHVLFVSHSRIDTDREVEMIQALWGRWSESVEKIGGHASRDAFDFQAGDAGAAEYVAKLGVKPGEAGKSWGQIAEITKHPVKTGEGMTLWELLAAYGGGDRHAGRMWLEATDALRGMSWLRPSRGLYERLGADALLKSDDDLATEQVEDLDMLFAGLPDDAWAVIKRLAKRGELLDQAGSGDVKEFRRWLDSLIVRKTTVDGTTWAQESEIVSAGSLVPGWALEGLQPTTDGQDAHSESVVSGSDPVEFKDFDF
jgi:hypothetical protein